MRSAFAFFDADVPVGVIALEKAAAGAARIQYIAVAPAQQRAGVGRRLIDEARRRESLNELVAETHIDAVPFYRRCGFEVTSLGELWPGVERFECRWRTPERSTIVAMNYLIKAQIDDPRASTFTFTAQKTMYGAKHIAKGDTIFVFASEIEGGTGLIARGVVASAKAIPRKPASHVKRPA